MPSLPETGEGGSPAPGSSDVILSAVACEKLLGLVDLAPIGGLSISPMVRRHAETLGYTQVRHVRNMPMTKLVDDLGRDHALALHAALVELGLDSLAASHELRDEP